MVEEENNRSRMYFGRCIAFFEDANNQIFIGVRWYEAADGGNSLIDPIVHLAKLKLSPANNSRSYGIMPATSIWSEWSTYIVDTLGIVVYVVL